MQQPDEARPDAKPAAATQARLAAEAAFTTTPVMVSSLPVVVVKRRKATIDDGVGDGSHGWTEESSAARSPRIHRIGSNPGGVPGEEATEPDANTTDVRDASPVPDDGPPAGARRRRRQKKHGDVTIIRPERPCTSKLAGFRREAMERYERLMAEIRDLDHQAEAVRKVESAEVVRWIRKAIVDYGLDAEDLGL